MHIILVYTWHFLFYLLYSLIFCFLNHVVSPIRLRLHVTQEVPLPPFIYNRFCHIEGNVDLGWGESKGRKLLIMLSYPINLIHLA